MNSSLTVCFPSCNCPVPISSIWVAPPTLRLSAYHSFCHLNKEAMTSKTSAHLTSLLVLLSLFVALCSIKLRVAFLHGSLKLYSSNAEILLLSSSHLSFQPCLLPRRWTPIILLGFLLFGGVGDVPGPGDSEQSVRSLLLPGGMGDPRSVVHGSEKRVFLAEMGVQSEVEVGGLYKNFRTAPLWMWMHHIKPPSRAPGSYVPY